MPPSSQKRPPHSNDLEETHYAALNGSLKHLREVASSSIPHCYSIGILLIFLGQLQLYPGDTVRIEEGSLRRRIDCVIETFKVICDLPQCLELFPELKKATIEQITWKLPELAAWMTCAVREPIYASHDDDRLRRIGLAVFGPGVLGARLLGPYQAAQFELSNRPQMQRLHCVSALAIRRIMELDNTLKARFMALHSSIEALLVLWVSTIDGDAVMDQAPLSSATGKRRGSADLPDLQSDPLVGNFLAFLRVRLSRGKIHRFLVDETVCPVSVFITSTLRRVQRITSSIKRKRATPFDICNFQELLEITYHLIVSAPAIQGLFMKHGLVPIFTECLMVLRHDLQSDKTRFANVIPRLVTFGSQIFAWTTYFSVSLMSNLSVLVKAGVLGLIVDSFTHSSDQPSLLSHDQTHHPTASEICSKFDFEHIRKVQVAGKGPVYEAAFMLSTLLRYTKYPRFLPELRRQMAMIPRSKIDVLPTNDERRVLYDALFEEVSERSEFIKRTKRAWGCDNLDHKNALNASSPITVEWATGIRNRKIRTCSKCHSVIYCSRACQRQDWICRHRLECSANHDHYLSLKHTDQWYSHATRAFQLSLVLDCCEGVLGHESHSKPPGGVPSPTLTSFSSLASTKHTNESAPHPNNSTRSLETPLHGSRNADPQYQALTLYQARFFKTEPTEMIWIFSFINSETQTQIPFEAWMVKNGRWIYPWLKPRLNQILERWRSSNPVLYQPHSPETVTGSRSGGDLGSARHLVDAQFDLGQLTLHLLVLLRKRDNPNGLEEELEPKPEGQGGPYEYEVEASLAFFGSRVDVPMTILQALQGIMRLLIRNFNSKFVAWAALGLVVALGWFLA